MKKRSMIAVSLFLSGMVGFIAIQSEHRARAQGTKPSPDDRTHSSSTGGGKQASRRGGSMQAPQMRGMDMPADDQPPFFNVTVDPTLSLTPDQQQLYQLMATDISGFVQIPADRTNYYSNVNSPPDYNITGWGGLVQNVQPNGCGYLVTVFVTPTITSDDYGAATTICQSDYCEIYQVNNDIPTYVGFTDPNGWAGQTLEIEGY